MSTREFKDPEGRFWYVSEVPGIDGRPYLSFDSVDESRRLFTFPPKWTELTRQQLTALFNDAEETWSRSG